MRKKKNKFLVIAVAFYLFSSQLYAQGSELEIKTLFTTQQERELINKNRYRKVQKKEVKAPVVTKVEEPEPEKQVIYKKQTLSLKVSGITLTEDGKNVAWVNGKLMEHGSALADGSKVYISPKTKNLVQIKTPDGKYHSVETGTQINITYLKTIEG